MIEKEPVLVKLFCGIILSEGMDFNIVKKALTEKIGAIDTESSSVDFSLFSDYYKDEMGSNLKRVFVGFHELANRTTLPDIKRKTIVMEKEYFSPDGSRCCNLDPGYLTLGQLFLASTKDNFCRIYIRDGIYEEVTLRYKGKTFMPFEHTYKDYGSEHYLRFFNNLRAIYKNQLAGLK